MTKYPRARKRTAGEPQHVSEKLLSDYLSDEAAAAELRVCKRTLDRWRRLGEAPPVTRVGRRVYYRRSTLRAWLCAREQQGSRS